MSLKAAIREEVREAMEDAVINISVPAEDAPTVISSLAANLDQLRVEAGWSFDDMYQATGISKKLSIGHIRHGKGITPHNLKAYADAFTKALKRPITAQDLSIPKPKCTV